MSIETIDAFLKNERLELSPCCGARVQTSYKSITSSRTALVFCCLKCDRLHVLDSRDDAAPDATRAMLEHKRACFITQHYRQVMNGLDVRILDNLNERIVALGGRAHRAE